VFDNKACNRTNDILSTFVFLIDFEGGIGELLLLFVFGIDVNSCICVALFVS
jgi:hypothetical protein